MIYWVNESSDKSVLDKNYSKRGKLKLSSLDLKEKRNDDDGESITLSWYKHNYLVATVRVDTKPASDGYLWFGSLKVSRRYRGYGLGEQIVKLMISSKYKAGALAVYQDNEVAINLYKKYGFEISKTRTDDEYYYMYLKKNKVR